MLANPKKCSKYTPKCLIYIIQNVLAKNSRSYAFTILIWRFSIATFTNYVTLNGSWMIYKLSANVCQSQLFSQSCCWRRVYILYLMQTPFSCQAEVFFSNQPWSATIVLPKTCWSLTKLSFFITLRDRLLIDLSVVEQTWRLVVSLLIFLIWCRQVDFEWYLRKFND